MWCSTFFFLEKSFTRFTSFLILWIFTLLYPTSLFWFDEKLLVNFKFIELGKNWYIVKFHWWCCLNFSFVCPSRFFYPVLSYKYHELSYLSYVLLAHVWVCVPFTRLLAYPTCFVHSFAISNESDFTVLLKKNNSLVSFLFSWLMHRLPSIISTRCMLKFLDVFG